MKKLSVLLLSGMGLLAASNAFADCANPASPNEAVSCLAKDLNARLFNVQANSFAVATYNYNLVNTAYDKYNFKHAFFQSTKYGYTFATTVALDLIKLGSMISQGKFDSVDAQYTKLQDDRRALFTDTSINIAAYAAVLDDAKLQAKIQGINTKDKDLVANNYSANALVTYLAPAALDNAYQFIANDTVLATNQALNSMTQGMCEAQVQPLQANFIALENSNPNVQILVDLAAPGSILKSILHKETFVVDALNMAYAYTTGQSPVVKNTSYNICDYQAFQAATKSNLYANALNNAINDVLAKTHSKVQAQNLYWAVTAGSALSLTQVYSGTITAPISQTGVSPFATK